MDSLKAFGVLLVISSLWYSYSWKFSMKSGGENVFMLLHSS